MTLGLQYMTLQIPGAPEEFGDIVTVYTPANSRITSEPPGSIPSLSPGLSIRGDSWTSSQSSILATPQLTEFTPSIRETTERLDSAVLSFNLDMTSQRNELIGNYHIQRSGQTEAQHMNIASRRRKSPHNAPRLAIIPLPNCDVEVDTTSPLVDSAVLNRRMRPQCSRKPSRSVIVCDYEESIYSPKTATTLDITRFSSGLVLSARSPVSGLGITIEDTQQFCIETNSVTSGLRRIHGCLDLKSLWLEVGVSMTRDDGMSHHYNTPCLVHTENVAMNPDAPNPESGPVGVINQRLPTS
jgi:hypothetical protein